MAVLLFAGATAAAAGAASPLQFKLGRGSVTPKESVPVSVKPIKIAYRFSASRATPISIRIVRTGTDRTIRRYTPGTQRPGRWHAVRWSGRTGSGQLANPGSYKVMVGPVGGPLRGIQHLRLHGHEFPVDAPHGTRGYIGEFHAPRVDGRTHEGFDITGNCGSPLVAVRSGRILKTTYDPDLFGNYVILKGAGENRTYMYAHLRQPAAVRNGQKVKAGRRLGSIGQTGNAAGTPCHVHFEVRSGGNLIDPAPLLQSWDW